ncbi:hypothetical protein [Phenylobacterium sp.]|uniref:hypothetical protein n=1 Tax=Phenylobacterium sp. TaxID=1871053 RepID=UPI0027291DF5|nr:hypothetical protein [Phenylobacterium sp.]MDO8799695.1 hypothetical protein [Phenylobacterium sp.]
MGGERNQPTVSGPEPSGLSTLWARLKAALAALAARRPRPADPAPREKTTRRAAKARQDPAAAAEVKAWRKVHGRPAIWMAPVFLVFAALYAVPHLALALEPQAPRSLITALVAALPSWAEPLSAMLAGWLWAPWWLGLLALLFRLRAAWTAGKAVLDAVGWGMAALVVEGGAWLFFGRDALEAFSVAEQTGAWRLLAAEFIFLFLTAVLFGPNTYQRVRFEQS